ncbi:MAG: hypothetical protein E6257_17890 [Clostridium botulinum]|nr:hypothetical protein [Clostridium botulinum]MDU5119936.1 hypothetical protein [Clostridium botulinum]
MMFVYKNGNTFAIVADPYKEECRLHKSDGSIYTNEELEDIGFFIDKYPEVPDDDNEYIMEANFETKELIYKSKETEEESIPQKITKLENDITVLQNSLVEQQYNELMKGVK